MLPTLLLAMVCQGLEPAEARLRWPVRPPCLPARDALALPVPLRDCRRCDGLDDHVDDAEPTSDPIPAASPRPLALALDYEPPAARDAPGSRLFWLSREAPPRGQQVGDEPAWLQVGLLLAPKRPLFIGAIFERQRDGPLQFAEQAWRPSGLQLGLHWEF